MKPNKKTLISILMGGSLLLSGCGLFPKEEQTLAPPLVKPQKQEYQLGEVKKTDIAKQIKGNGTLISSNESDLFTKENGRRIKNLNVKFGQVVKKGEILIEFDSDNLADSVKIEQLNLKKAQLNYDKAQQGTDDYAKQFAAIDLQTEQVKLEGIQRQLTASRLTAPVDGTVVFVETVKEGDVAEPYKPLVTIADPKKLQVAYQSQDAAKVQTGMKVDLTVSGQKYEGMVSQLPTTGKYKDNIIVTFKTSPQNANLGDSAELAITLETKKDTLVVPKQAVKSFMGSNTVEVLDGNKKISVDVEVGIQNYSDTEILSGLKEGQKVIIN